MVSRSIRANTARVHAVLLSSDVQARFDVPGEILAGADIRRVVPKGVRCDHATLPGADPDCGVIGRTVAELSISDL